MYGEGQSVEAAHEAERTEREARRDLIDKIDMLTQAYARAEVQGDEKGRKKINAQIETLREKMAS
jgi:hypothetical protein